MLPPMPLSAASQNVREKLIATAADLMATRGLRAVTARALADLTGQSASAVNYHFAGREGLLAATFDAAADQVTAWRAGWADTLRAVPPVEAFSGWFLAFVLDQIQAGAPFLVLRELRHHAARSPVYRDRAGAETARSDAFWLGATEAFGLPAGSAEACADFSDAILGIHAGAPDHPDQMAWLAETTRRFCARLAGDRGQAPGWDGWRQRARARARSGQEASDAVPLSESANRIATAAAEVLGRAGMEGLTHRSVAAEVGLSLAAVSGHFPSRASLVRGAFDCLIASIQVVRGEVVPELEVPRPAEVIAREMADVLFDAEGAAAPGLLALDELLSASFRDSELRRDAEDLRASRGENSASLLARIRHGTRIVDGLDAHVLSIVITGAMRGAYAQPPEARRAWLARRITANLTALFGSTPTS